MRLPRPRPASPDGWQPPFSPRLCAACRPKPGEHADHAACRYAYGCECWCLDGRAHEFPMKETP